MIIPPGQFCNHKLKQTPIAPFHIFLNSAVTIIVAIDDTEPKEGRKTLNCERI
jgi:hypothetical protein